MQTNYPSARVIDRSARLHSSWMSARSRCSGALVQLGIAIDALVIRLISGGVPTARLEPSAPRGDRGQTTAEYALVLIGVAALALLVLAWATSTGKVGELLDKVFDSVIDKVP